MIYGLQPVLEDFDFHGIRFPPCIIGPKVVLIQPNAIDRPHGLARLMIGRHLGLYLRGAHPNNSAMMALYVSGYPVVAFIIAV
jgi:hypothetical protein